MDKNLDASVRALSKQCAAIFVRAAAATARSAQIPCRNTIGKVSFSGYSPITRERTIWDDTQVIFHLVRSAACG